MPWATQIGRRWGVVGCAWGFQLLLNHSHILILLHAFPAAVQDLGDEEAPADLKVNFGEQMLAALFSGWAALQQRSGAAAVHGPAGGGDDSGGGDAAMADADGGWATAAAGRVAVHHTFVQELARLSQPST